VDSFITQFGEVDILVNNAAIQPEKENFEDISEERWDITFRTNIYPFYYFTKYCLPHFGPDASIINLTSVNAYKGGPPQLIDYTSTKGAILGFTRSLAAYLIDRGIRVNAIAPGPIWTPLIPTSMTKDDVKSFGTSTPMKRAGQPSEVAAPAVFLACSDSSYITGSTLHPNGGVPVNS